ncbi:unnamed protein product [Rodentolepis nana]|uniref:DUF3730 domain-containing protein n=1 Tax=Rodentolepis nana TaxID=102285 RepID=A0A0R3TSJ2_RODNA|nr:unnamed protein product [Rodentolepis nana]
MCNENSGFARVSQAAVNIVEIPLKAKNRAEYLPAILPAFATGGTLAALGDLAIHMTTVSIAEGEHSRRIHAALVECGRESGRCFFELASFGLELGSIASPLDHPFVVGLGGAPSDRLWRVDARFSERSKQLEPLIDSIIATVKTSDGKINPGFVDLVVSCIRTSDNAIFSPVCKFLTYLLFKALDSHGSPASSIANRSTPTVSRSQGQTLLNQLAFALVSIEDDDKTSPILKQLLSPGQSLPTLLWSLSTLIAIVAVFENARTLQPMNTFPALAAFATSAFTVLQGNDYLGSSNSSARYYAVTLLAFITRWGSPKPDAVLMSTLENLLGGDQSASVRVAACCFLECQIVEALETGNTVENRALSCLLESGCTDGAMEVQETALGALRRIFEMSSSLKDQFFQTSVHQRLMAQYNAVNQQVHRPGLLRRLLATRNQSQTPTSANQSTNSPVQESLLTHLSALCLPEKNP